MDRTETVPAAAIAKRQTIRAALARRSFARYLFATRPSIVPALVALAAALLYLKGSGVPAEEVVREASTSHLVAKWVTVIAALDRASELALRWMRFQRMVEKKIEGP